MHHIAQLHKAHVVPIGFIVIGMYSIVFNFMFSSSWPQTFHLWNLISMVKVCVVLARAVSLRRNLYFENLNTKTTVDTQKEHFIHLEQRTSEHHES